MLQGKRDVDTVLTMGIMEDVSIVPQPAGGNMNYCMHFMPMCIDPHTSIGIPSVLVELFFVPISDTGKVDLTMNVVERQSHGISAGGGISSGCVIF